MTRTILLPVVIVKTKNSYNASSPKIPGCVATDKTTEKTLARYSKAVALHLKYDERAKDKLSKARSHASLIRYIKEYGPKSFYTFIEIKLKR